MVETTDNSIVAPGFLGRLKPPPRSLAPLRRKPLAGLTAPTPAVLSGVLAAHAAELRAEAGGGGGGGSGSSGGSDAGEPVADEAEADAALRESMQALAAATAGLPELPELTVQALDAVRLQGSSGRTWVLRVLRLYEARVRTLEGELAISARERATVCGLQQTLAQERQRASALRAVCRALLPLQVGADAAAASERRSKEAAKHAEALATIVRQAEGLRKEKAAAAARATAAEGEVAAAKAAAEESERRAKAAAAAAAPVQRERDELQRAKRQLEGRLEKLAEEAAQLRRRVEEVRLEGAAAAEKARAAGEAAAAKGEAEKARRTAQEAAAAAAARSAEQARQADAAEMAKLRGAVAAAEGEVELQGEAWRAEAQACLELLLPHCSHPSVLQGEVNAAVQRAIVDVTQALAAAKSSLEASQNVVRMLKDMADMHREEIAQLSAAHGSAVEKLKAEFAASRRPPSEPPPREQSTDKVSRVDRACSPVAHLSEVVVVVSSSRPAPASKAAAAAGPKVSQRVQAAVERMQDRQNEREKKWREKKNKLREERACRKQGVLASVGHFETGDDDGADVSDGRGSDEGEEDDEEGSSSSQHSEEDGRQKLREILARLQGERVRPAPLPQAEDVLAERQKQTQPSGAAGDLPISLSFGRGGGGGGGLGNPEAAEAPKQSKLADLVQKLRGGGV